MIQIDDDGYVSPIQMIMGEIKSQVEYQQGQATWTNVQNFLYCPNCGAKMDGETDADGT